MVRIISRWLAACALAVFICSASSSSAAPLSERFSEELLLQPVPGNLVAVSNIPSLLLPGTTQTCQTSGSIIVGWLASAVLQAHLHFEIEGALGSSHILFSRVVDQLCAVTNVTEFHLALTQGRWVSHSLGSALCCTACPCTMQHMTNLDIETPFLPLYTILTFVLQHASRWGRALEPALPAGAQLRAQFQQGLSQEVRWHTLESRGSKLPQLGAGDVRMLGTASQGVGVDSQAERSSWAALAHGLSGIYCGSLNFLDAEEHITAPSFVFGPGSGHRRHR